MKYSNSRTVTSLDSGTRLVTQAAKPGSTIVLLRRETASLLYAIFLNMFLLHSLLAINEKEYLGWAPHHALVMTELGVKSEPGLAVQQAGLAILEMWL